MSKTKIAFTGNPDEDLYRTLGMHLTREQTRAEADALFGGAAADMRKKDRGELEKLFVQTPASQTMAPNLQKQASAEMPEPDPVLLTANVDAFFEKLSAPDDAQRRYPELLKVAQKPTPNLKPRPDTQAPVRSNLSGGAA
jgi:hypothetical protein